MTDAMLLAWKAGALEPGRALEVEEALRVHPELWARVASLPSLEPEADSWRVPPPGVFGGRAGFGVQVRQAAVFGGGLRAGDRFQLTFEADEKRFVVVLRRVDGAWTVVHPVEPGDELRVGELPVKEGQRVLDLLAADRPGVQDWAVALPEVLPSNGDWRGLQAGVADGTVPVASARVVVRA